MKDILAYYTSHSPFTDPGPYAYLYDDLPGRPDELAGIIHGLLLHKLVANYYKVTLGRVQRAEQFLRTVEQRLAKLMEVDPAPLITPREPHQRQVGMCRDFALLHVSMLRHKGIPARMRVGFAKYLDPKGPLIIDHWIAEYWNADQSRWVLTDPQIDDIQREIMRITIDVTSLRRNEDFYLAGSAWQLCRQGKARSSLFRFSERWKGMPCIRGNMLHDFQALNKFELGVQDYWDELILKNETSLTVEDKHLLDRIAELTVDADNRIDEMQDLFDQLPRTRTILSKLRDLGIMGDFEAIDPDTLQPSGLDRLAALSGNGKEPVEG